MDSEKRKRLEKAGWQVGDVDEFLGLTQSELQLVELKLSLSRTVRQLRENLGLTQKELASRMKSSQSRVAKIEAAAADVSLDLFFRALFTAGGRLSDLSEEKKPSRKESKKKAPAT
jgi:ribosome-binding protein aMBF1 (putative translation factor)